mmetsp:Transcript_15258/g.30401  ORF Transcript_15258/g.30401 Transcript_15258/m.30401 type:complete len:95 (+) Transcript_15258:274-558(+)
MERSLYQISMVRRNMLHVTLNVQSYFMFEVLEVSWDALAERVSEAGTLDALIDAHNSYLADILQKALLGEDADSLQIARLLFTIFGISDRFCRL